MNPKRLVAILTSSLLAAGILGIWSRPAAGAAEQLRGLVLSVLAQQHEVVVRHEAYGSMPPMTMLFRLSPRTRLASLREGDRIAARVENGRAGPVLDDVRVLVAAPLPPPPSDLRNVPLLQAGDPMPQTRFIDQFGHPFALSDYLGDKVVLAFIYTRCRDPRMCPLISANFHSLQRLIGNGGYHLVEITLDPAYDTPPVLRRYAALFGADPRRWTLGTGDPRAVLDFAARFAIEPFPDPRVGLIHTERTVLIDANGRIADFIDEAGWSAEDVMARLQAIDAAPSNPLARLDYELSKAAVAVCGNSVARFSGLADLVIVLLIFGGAGLLLYRVAGRIFREQS
jgi:protein SCO1/2